MSTLRFLAAAAVLTVALGCGALIDVKNDLVGTNARMVSLESELVSDDYPDVAIMLDSAMPIFSEKDLTHISDLVVRGKVAAQRKTSKSFVEEMQYSEREGDTVDATFTYHMILHSFQVDEYLKGAGGKAIRIVTYDSDKHPTEPELERGQSYILYLGLTREGTRDFHENAYSIEAFGQGVWKINGGEATQQFGDNKTATLSRLRELAGKKGNEDVENYTEYLDRSELSTAELTLPDSQLRDIADLIVRGAPTGEAQARKPPRYPADYPDYMREQDAELLEETKVFSFSVSEYYKGQGAATINIFTDGGANYPFLDEGASYVLYLNAADFEAARAHYEGGGWVILAAGQGTWKVNGERATRQFGDGETVQLSAFGR